MLHAAVRPKFAGELARMLLSEAVSSAQTSGGGGDGGGGERRAVFARFSQRQFFVVVVSPPPHCGLSCLKKGSIKIKNYKGRHNLSNVKYRQMAF